MPIRVSLLQPLDSLEVGNVAQSRSEPSKFQPTASRRFKAIWCWAPTVQLSQFGDRRVSGLAAQAKFEQDAGYILTKAQTAR